MKQCGCGKEITDDLEMCKECADAARQNTPDDRDNLWDDVQVDESTGELKPDKQAEADKRKTDDDPAANGFSDKLDPQGLSDKTDPKDAGKDHQSKAEQPGADEDVVSLKRRLSDTQAWGQKLATEVAELKKMIQGGTATDAEIRGQQKVVDDAKKAIAPDALAKLYDEVPEAKAVVEPLMDLVNTLKGEVDTYKQSEAAKKQQEQAEAKKRAIEEFENTVVPKVRETHKDYDPSKLGDLGYFEWAEKQRPGMQFMALNSNDPADIAEAFGAFKKHLASPEAQQLKQTETDRNQKRMQDAMTLKGGGGMHTSGGKKTDPNDRDAAWDDPEFDKKLKQDGLL
jgi:hypothetical protein